MPKQKKGVMYKVMHERLKNSVIGSELMPRKRLFTIFGRVYHIPKSKKYAVMNELVDLEIITFENRMIKVLD
jgi:hypothetical protein